MIAKGTLKYCLYILILFCAQNAAPHAQDISAERASHGLPPPMCLARGEHDVGYMLFAVNQNGYWIEGGIWYPAQPAAGASRVTYLVEPTDHRLSPLSLQPGTAVDHAEINSASGPYPLVIATYENVGQIYTNAYLHELLVSRGFIVIAVMHPFDNLPRQAMESGRAYRMLNSLDSLNSAALKKEAVIDYVLDIATADGSISGMVDFYRVAFVEMSPPRSPESQAKSGGVNCGVLGREGSSTSLSPGC